MANLLVHREYTGARPAIRIIYREGTRPIMRVVSNAFPLINPARIGKLTLLRDLEGELIVPEAVWQENGIR